MNTITVKKARKSYDVDFGALPQASKDYVIQYGLTQILNDCVSQGKNPKDYNESEGATHAADNAKTVEQKLGNLLEGVIRLARVSGGANPIETKARIIAISKVKSGPKYQAWLTEQGLKPSDAKAIDELRERAKVLATKPEILAEAQRQVDAEAALGDIDV